MFAEDARQCRRCGFRWYAQRVGQGAPPNAVDRWARCPNCGSVMVDTVAGRGFVPTGAGSPQQVAREQAAQRSREEREQVEAEFRRAQQWEQLQQAEQYRRAHPVRTGFVAFMKVHWRITLAILCTIAVLGSLTSDEAVGERISGGLFSLALAVLFWVLHVRHRRVASGDGALDQAPPAATTAQGRLDMGVEDAWARRLSGCRDKAATFAAIVAQTPPDLVGDWLQSMTAQIDDQLRQADALATLGRSVEPRFTGAGAPANPAAREVWSRLGAFEQGMDEMVTGAARVRLNALEPAANLESIRVQLDMLQGQLPTLDPR